ncbi:MAG: acyltransferase [Bacteroides sp.]|nr:acyltransferase [Bacteroides sp.]
MRFQGLNREIDAGLSWRLTEIMRGVSIILIMLHNLFHVYPTIVKECEFTYSPGLTKMFFDKLAHSDGFTLFHILSFLGWFGVPVFIFLSGYGLTRRYDAGHCDSFDRWGFIRRNWIKLFQLMLLGVSIFFVDQIVNDLIRGEGIKWGALWRILIPLTELNDVVQLWGGTIPGVYWYFGLAFEFYVFYALCVQGHRQRWMWIFTAICFFAFFYFSKHPILTDDPNRFEAYIRHNIVGWMLPFACGVWLGRARRIRLLTVILILVTSFVLFLPSQKNIYTWQFSAVFAVGIIFTISLLFAKIPYWTDLWGWIGRLSAYLFVAHPIVRHLTRTLTFSNPNQDPALPAVVPTLIYVALTFLAALLYRYINSLLFHK